MVQHKEPEKKLGLSQQPVFRVGLVLIIVLAAFALVQQLSIPESFGEYGYYRGDNVDEWAGMEVSYAEESNTCAACHAEKYKIVEQAEHGQFGCQTCHEAAQEHTTNPGSFQPTVEANREFCGSCHYELEGRSEQNIKLISADHNGDSNCVQCHDPHQPWSMFGGGN